MDPNLVTSCNFHGQEVLFKMNATANNLEILITDKNSGEEWQCSYDATYIENLTQKTGNFKQFSIFVTMIKSGLLRTSECVTLDLLTYEDLEFLRSRRLTKFCGRSNTNRRYLIITYCVEFDRIRYPLPLEYCGPPDPVVLQTTIKRLEAEIQHLKELRVGNLDKRSFSESRKMHNLQKKIDELQMENIQLKEENEQLIRICQKNSKNNKVFSLEKAIAKLEKSLVNERNSHHNLVEKLRREKSEIIKELDKQKHAMKALKAELKKPAAKGPSKFGHGDYISPCRKNSETSTNSGNNNMRVEKIYEYKPANSKTLHPWTKTSPRPKRFSRRDSFNQNSPVRSRSNSSSSKNCEKIQSIFVNPKLPNSNVHNSVVLIDRSRSSSAGSRASSKDFSKRLKSPRNQDPTFKKLEEKIESLQRMLKRNFMN